MGLSNLIDGGLRLREQERLVRKSGLFDADWYGSRYPESGGAGKALSYFLREGAARGHDPGPKFNAGAYLSDNPDVRQAGINPLIHFLRFGRVEGRKARDSEGRLSGVASEDIGAEGLKRLVEVFEPDFYRATNPDLADDVDLFAHFMSFGWRERRDPASWFSVEHYLSSYEDVANEDQNPFTHYVLWGCREGRAVRASRRPKLEVPKASIAGPLKTIAIAMVKNEADIIRFWAAHILALFDEIIVVDHGSEDGTAEFLQALSTGNERVRFLRLMDPSYIQSVTMTHVVRTCPEVAAADWVFFLDADEFLPFADRMQFHQALKTYRACPVIAMHWRNLVPGKYWQDEVYVDKRTEFLAPKCPSSFAKIAFQPVRLNLSRVVVAQGNHSLSEMLNGSDISSFTADFPLLHIPVRSIDQLVLKLNQGVLSYQKLGKKRDATQGTHWVQLKEATTGVDLSDELLNAVAVNYSEEKPALQPVSQDALMTSGFEVVRYDLAAVDLKVSDLPRRSLGEMMMRIYAQDFSNASKADNLSATQLHQSEDGFLVRSEDDPGAEYAPLKAIQTEGTSDIKAALKQVFQPSYQQIENLLPEDWAGHIPFMFSLCRLLQPRRFVELGTLRGSAMFAFAQAMKQASIESVGVAISSWAVDEQQAENYQTVFDDFQFIARGYPDTIATLRMGYEVAASRFAKGSIDLLHFDGFRTFDDLQNQLEFWLPKLSDRGVLLVHDINSHDEGFGVWRVWDELKTQYPTLEFPHAQGLGVACVGQDVPLVLGALCGGFAKNSDLRILLQEHFLRMGQMSTELFARRFDMAQADMRVGAEGAQAEEISWLRQQLSSAKAELCDLKTLLNKELHHVASA